MEFDLELDVIEHEPTVLEYARYHKICSDYTQEPLQINRVVPLTDDAFDLDLQDPKNASPLTNPADELMKERLAVTQEAAMLLKTVHDLHEAPADLLLIRDGRKRIRALKQEIPILQTDNELDMLNFGSTVEPSFSDLRIPLEPVNEEQDEGLEWPSKYSVLPEQCFMQAHNEKLGITKDVLVFLQNAIRDPSTVRPITPPLLPSTPPWTPYIPSSPGNHLELVSDDSNSTAAEARSLGEQIMNADALVRHDSNGSDVMLMDMLDTGDYEESLAMTNSPQAKRKASDLKIEGPLTPQMFSESPAKKLKTVTFADTLVEYIPTSNDDDNKDDPDLPSKFENGNYILTEEEDYAFYNEIVVPAAKDANWKVENEKLSEADTTKRVQVPQVDFRLPTAPWDEFARSNSPNVFDTEIDAQARFIQWVKRNHMKSFTSWHGISELERTLPLAPFSHEAAKVSVVERLHGEEVLIKMLAEITKGEIATSSTDLWKRDGLRILEDSDEEDDTLEPAELEEPKDVDSLVRKRKLELEDSARDQGPARRTNATSVIVNKRPHPQQEVIESHHWKTGSLGVCAGATLRAAEARKKDFQSVSVSNQPVGTRERDMSLMFGGQFSATSALDNFMALHGMTAKPKACGKEEPAPNRRPAPPLPSPIRPVMQVRNDANQLAQTAVLSNPEVTHLPLKLPALPPNMPPCSFVISSNLLQRRSVSRLIESLYSAAEFVSRDFDSEYTVNSEADMILSPSTGLIMTTLQQLKQRALPGQPDHSPVKARMTALQYTYERLVVLVSEGLSREREGHATGRCSDDRDKAVIEEYQKVAAQMEGEILVRYVPGGEQALARTIVGEMAQYGLPHGSKDIGDIKLLSDQTTWELFLRRAGLNAFAAQVILALLKDPIDWPQLSKKRTDPTSNTTKTYGLQNFLFMSTEQRVQSFQTILGGSRVLKRVSALLDEPWLSAAHGFRMC
ncbi:hypothetical protein BU23DRAFT_544899 [Bimuria novae-zelandiae CBS 107.79]|uniref:Uncharacterized protein n=1 Tax=Bimuria novae-zelandiae CBS 107.79 TaxID=1447943 RepID=A0A6A5UQF0_9PLEO|nr:hypothetical protein BU23DRAFT_544899 [Bimuria novae-zelandiae CBS 107.79]